MNILFSITYYHPYISGLTLAASRWAEGLAKTGENVSVLTVQHEKSLPQRSRIGNVSVYRARWIVRVSKGFVSFDWLRKSWRLAGVSDVTVVNLPQFEGVIPALVAKLCGKPVIAIYHCEIVLPSGFFTNVTQSFIEISNFITLLLADRVVTYTRDYANASRLLRSLNKIRKDIEIVPIVPPIPKPGENKALTNIVRKKMGKSDIIIGVAARLAAEKGIEYVLGAIPFVAKAMNGQIVRVVIAGSTAPVGEAAYKSRIMKLVKKYKKHVIFLGEIKPEYMGSFYRLLDVLVLPSINSTEAFGMVQVEAMRWGVPVVASNLPGVRVPVKKTRMGELVTARNSAELARALCQVLMERNRYTSSTSNVAKIFPEKRSVELLRALIHVNEDTVLV